MTHNNNVVRNRELTINTLKCHNWFYMLGKTYQAGKYIPKEMVLGLQTGSSSQNYLDKLFVQYQINLCSCFKNVLAYLENTAYCNKLNSRLGSFPFPNIF